MDIFDFQQSGAFDLYNRRAGCRENAELMRQLKEEGVYEITEEMRGQLGDFVGGFATEEETKETIKIHMRKLGM